MRSWVLALLLSIPLAAAGVAGVALHVCQSMGGGLGECDCEERADHAGHQEERAHANHAAHGEHGAHAKHAPAQKLESQPCCTVELSEATSWVATHEASTLRIEDADTCFLALSRVRAPRSRLALDSTLLRERAPPNIHGPPIFVRHCSFLN